MQSLNDPIYRAAFAKWAPIMADRWCGATNATTLVLARQDVVDAIEMHEAQSHWSADYLGKLYAELDAIRDRQHEMSRVERAALRARQLAARPAPARKAAHSCADCGAEGETTGHQACAYPQDR